MTARIDAEEMETTRGEKLLTVVLSIFMLIGGLWAYHNVDDIGRPSVAREGVSPAERAALSQYRAAQGDRQDAEQRRSSALQDLELRREAYRTALEAGQPVAELEAAYLEAQADLRDADQAVAGARASVQAASPAARDANASIRAAERERSTELRDRERSHDRQTFFLRLALVLAGLVASYRSLGRLRRQRSRYVLIPMAGIGAAAVLALYLAGDYLEYVTDQGIASSDAIEVADLGILALSLAGIALTVTALIALQRYLAKRLPLRRVRKHQCPFCGFPVGADAHCEGCGRRIVGECTTCHQPRRVGAEHCGACGAA
jgi:hypothetical protein